ncbi:MAG: hypothetical protein HC884_14960 [Chloroflexaceae bacterium]|nr:hypothetical protein [Chloroflexaceae bacterium]
MKEREIAQALAEREGGRCEVKTPVGRIDVLTSKYVYEVKGATEWKGAMGQVLAYQSYYPNHKPRLYLYGKPAITKKLIEEQCKIPVRVLLQRIPDTQGRIQALVREGFCRNRGNAQAVVVLSEQHERNSDRLLVRTGVRDGHLRSPPSDQLGQADVDAVVQTIRTVFQRVAEADQRAIALVEVGLCTTLAQAQSVGERLSK